MADVFYTILIIWILSRIFGGTTKHTVQRKHEYQQPQKKEGEVTITQTKSSSNKNNDSGEYVDYEEVK